MKYFLLWLLLSLIWGTTWAVIKIGDDYLPPIAFCGIRFVIAGPVLLAFCALLRKPVLPPREMWPLLFFGGILNFTGNYGLIFWSEQYIPAGLAALIASLTPGWTMLIAHRFLPGEPLSRVKLAGLLLGVSGVALVLFDQLQVAGAMGLLGCAAMLISTFCSATTSVWSKAKGNKLDPALLGGWTMLLGSLPLLIIGIIVSGNPIHYNWTPPAIAALLYLALIGSSLAFFLFFYLLRHVDVGKVITTNLVTPIIAVLVGWLLMGEGLNGTALVGGLLILAGVGLIVRPKVFSTVRAV